MQVCRYDCERICCQQTWLVQAYDLLNRLRAMELMPGKPYLCGP